MDPENTDRMSHVIETRHSSRGPFDPAWHVTEHELARIMDAARWAPTAHNMQNFRLIVVDDPMVLAELGRIRSQVSPEFIVENYAQLSWSHEELEQRGTGLLGTMFPRSWWTADLACAPKDVSRLLGETIAGAPLVIVVAYDPTQRAPASEGDQLGMISLGCVLENMWLVAQAEHLDVQIASAFAAGGAEVEVKRVLGVPSPWRVAFAMRFGHALIPSHPHRVRRAIAASVGRNRF
jgi:nitroreductase